MALAVASAPDGGCSPARTPGTGKAPQFQNKLGHADDTGIGGSGEQAWRSGMDSSFKFAYRSNPDVLLSHSSG